MGAVPNHLPLRINDGEEPDVEASSDGYARRFSGPVGEWFLEVQTRITRELLAPLPPSLRILDVGGGHAQLTPALLDAGHEVVVLGSSPVCGERLKPFLHTGRCHFEVGGLRDLPYPDQSFDVALSFRLLSHVLSPETLIRELCRVSSRAVLLDYPSTRSLNVLAQSLFSVKLLIEKNTRTFTSFSPRFIRTAFERQGFRLAAARPQYLLPMALYRLLGSRSLSRGIEEPAARLGITRTLGSPTIVRADRGFQLSDTRTGPLSGSSLLR
jgi:SAM-dependent methyltransferase